MLMFNKAPDRKYTIDYTFESGDHEGEHYLGNISICDNPVCTCEKISLILKNDDGSQDQQFPPQPFSVRLDLHNRCIDKKLKTESLILHNFAKSLTTDMTEEDWQLLLKQYLGIKTQRSESCNPADIRVEFPEKDIEETSLMISYNHLLPYGRQILVRVGNDDYIAMDYYCVKEHCNCTTANISFVPIVSGKDLGCENTLILDIDYNNGKWRTEEIRGDCPYSDSKFINTLKEKYRDLMKVLQGRHSRLKLIYKHNRESKPNSQTTGSTLTVGRNDPCPCGSGKKYKKCCIS